MHMDEEGPHRGLGAFLPKKSIQIHGQKEDSTVSKIILGNHTGTAPRNGLLLRQKSENLNSSFTSLNGQIN